MVCYENPRLPEESRQDLIQGLDSIEWSAALWSTEYYLETPTQFRFEFVVASCFWTIGLSHTAFQLKQGQGTWDPVFVWTGPQISPSPRAMLFRCEPEYQTNRSQLLVVSEKHPSWDKNCLEMHMRVLRIILYVQNILSRARIQKTTAQMKSNH